MLSLIREPSDGNCTFGSLFVDGKFQCFTLEDVIREIPGKDVSEWKIPGKTAIPAGTYEVEITFSNRFQRPMPLLLNVPGFDGIRIHPGNTSEDTDGCILVGQARGQDTVLESRVAFDELFEILNALDKTTLEIRNPA